MITLTAEQALEVIAGERMCVGRWSVSDKDVAREALVAIRAARVQEQTKVYPGSIEEAQQWYADGCLIPAEQAEQEPVIGAYEVVNEKGDEWSLVYPAAVHKYKSIPEERITQTFYAAPVRTKDLTDDEISRVWMLNGGGLAANCYHEFARAVIAAHKEKNR